jgi:hypothetical protein
MREESARMNASALRPSVRAAFEGLIDYAGLFPPAQLPMAEALAEYAGARAETEAWMLGRFILPLSRVEEAAALRRKLAAPSLPVSLIADVPADARAWFGAIQTALAHIRRVREETNEFAIGALEVPLARRTGARETFDPPIAQLGVLLDRNELRDLPVFVELPREPLDDRLLDGAMTALARARLSGKLRCGGTTAEMFPSVEAIAGFIAAAARHRVAFKATAGLHHPVRHLDAATGFVMHGFLNILAAAALALDLDGESLALVVSEEDPRAFAFDDAAFAWRSQRTGIAEIETMRAKTFVGYGSCSFDEPVADLRALSLLPKARAQ